MQMLGVLTPFRYVSYKLPPTVRSHRMLRILFSDNANFLIITSTEYYLTVFMVFRQFCLVADRGREREREGGEDERRRNSNFRN